MNTHSTDNTRNRIVVDGKPIYLFKYHSITAAKSALYRCRAASRLMLGDHDDPWGGYWICRPVDAEKLIRAGYEMAPQ